MQKSEIRIFIVDDDVTMAKAMEEAIKKAGFQPVVCTNPADALNQFRIRGSQFFIVDCLLPKMSGIDLVVKLRAEGAAEIPILLTSGVYRDKTFTKDALHRTGAIGFLSKPFNVKDLVDVVNKALEKIIDEDMSPLESLLTAVHSPGEKIKLINQLEEISAYDIPWVCCLLMNPATSGTLGLKNGTTTATISISHGKIVQVEMANPESFFGALLIEHGYLTPEQLDQALKIQSKKRVGERLVEMNMLSPHVIDLMNAEQMAIRLSRIITDTTYAISFVEKPVEQRTSHIDIESIAPFLVDWVNTKIQLDFLKTRYLKWLNSSTFKITNAPILHRIWTLPPLKSNLELVREFEKGQTLGQVLSVGSYSEDLLYQVFHILILIDFMRLKHEIRITDESAQVARLKKIWADMEKQTLFAILGLTQSAKPADIKKTYHELAKIFHPDKLPPSASPALKDLAQKVFSHMTKAYETLSDEKRKATYVKEIEMGRAEKILQAESLLEEGKALLKSGKATKAREKFEESIPLRPPTSELLIHLAWARMMTLGDNATAIELLDIDSTLNKIPPEDRHNKTYYFVKGQFQNMVGEDLAAKKNVLHALSLDPKFLEAERLLRALELKKPAKNKGGFQDEITAVVGNFFKKK